MSVANRQTAGCGCDSGSSALTPAPVENPAGRSALCYRVGTHSSFTATMRAAVSRQAGLAGLTARHDADPSIALIDAWAIVLDALTFYQERIANEGYLRTATDRRSILELARAIGYELNPGVAASTALAFGVDDAGGSLASITLDTGIKVQSVPGPNELPQIFETTQAIAARPEWNSLRPQSAARTYPDIGTTLLYLRGTSTNLKSGDRLLVVGDERLDDPASDRWDVRRVRAVTVVPPSAPTADPGAGFTVVELHRGIGEEKPKRLPAAANPKVYAFRQRAALFGSNAPDWLVMSKEIKEAYGNVNATQWPHFNIAYAHPIPAVVDELYLDALYPAISEGSWLVVSLPHSEELFAVSSVADASKTDFTMTAKTTLVRLEGPELVTRFKDGLREIVVFAATELLDWADTPIVSPVSGAAVTLDAHVDGLSSGRLMVASGTSVTGVSCSEVLSLARTETRAGLTRLVFTTALLNSYARDSLTIYANVAPATHGETTTEILGSGDGSRRFQTFTLKQSPLTHVPAATASGSQTTLQVRVNDILWAEVTAFYGIGPTDRVYVTRLTDDDTVTVEFGDGVTGARLPTGTENITATYRTGSGLPGLSKAGQVSLLMTRPLGLSSATNPLAASGAADAEVLDQARRNAPLTVLTMERIVSLQDCEDFVRAFAGIGKAQATLLWNGQHQMVHVTIAAADGGDVDPSSALYMNLRLAIAAARHATRPIQIETFLPQDFDVEAKLLVDARYLADDVMARVAAAMEQAFSFSQREFGQPVTTSDVLGVMQSVDGVVAVDLDALYLTGTPKALPSALLANRAHWELGGVIPATLLTLRPEGLVLSEMR